MYSKKNAFNRYCYFNARNSRDTILLPKCSNEYRSFDEVVLPFDFPFYGFPVKKVRISSSGYISIPSLETTWTVASQYVAPLGADFDPSGEGARSRVLFFVGHNSVTVRWENMRVRWQDGLGEFTFQTTLAQNGDIVFAYKGIDSSLTKIDTRYL